MEFHLWNRTSHFAFRGAGPTGWFIRVRGVDSLVCRVDSPYDTPALISILKMVGSATMQWHPKLPRGHPIDELLRVAHEEKDSGFRYPLDDLYAFETPPSENHSCSSPMYSPEFKDEFGLNSMYRRSKYCFGVYRKQTGPRGLDEDEVIAYLDRPVLRIDHPFANGDIRLHLSQPQPNPGDTVALERAVGVPTGIALIVQRYRDPFILTWQQFRMFLSRSLTKQFFNTGCISAAIGASQLTNFRIRPSSDHVANVVDFHLL